MRKDAELLLSQYALLQSMKMEQRRLRSPADGKAAMHIALCPVEDRPQFRQIEHIAIIEPLDRRAGDDEAIEMLLAHIAPGTVESRHMISRCIAGNMVRDPHQCQLDLQRRRA